MSDVRKHDLTKESLSINHQIKESHERENKY